LRHVNIRKNPLSALCGFLGFLEKSNKIHLPENGRMGERENGRKKDVRRKVQNARKK